MCAFEGCGIRGLRLHSFPSEYPIRRRPGARCREEKGNGTHLERRMYARANLAPQPCCTPPPQMRNRRATQMNSSGEAADRRPEAGPLPHIPLSTTLVLCTWSVSRDVDVESVAHATPFERNQEKAGYIGGRRWLRSALRFDVAGETRPSLIALGTVWVWSE